MDQNEPPPNSSARTLAIIAIVIALTAPFWEGALLGTINIRMPLTEDVAENARALDRLDRRTADLERQLAAATTQLGRLQTQVNETAGRAKMAADATATLAMAELANALRRSGGFELELAALRGAIPDQSELRPLLQQIEAYAATGVPSAAHLRREFSQISSRLQWGERGYQPIAWVMRLISWQRPAVASTLADATSTPQLLGQANAQLGNGDLAGAVTTVQSITGAPQEVVADWLEDAKARVAVDAVVQRLNEQIGQRNTRPPARKA